MVGVTEHHGMAGMLEQDGPAPCCVEGHHMCVGRDGALGVFTDHDVTRSHLAAVDADLNCGAGIAELGLGQARSRFRRALVHGCTDLVEVAFVHVPHAAERDRQRSGVGVGAADHDRLRDGVRECRMYAPSDLLHPLGCQRDEVETDQNGGSPIIAPGDEPGVEGIVDRGRPGAPAPVSTHVNARSRGDITPRPTGLQSCHGQFSDPGDVFQPAGKSTSSTLSATASYNARRSVGVSRTAEVDDDQTLSA